MKIYKIGNRYFIQKKLYLGVIRQCLEALKDVSFSEASNIVKLLSVLGDKFPKLLSILLVETNENGEPLPKKSDLETFFETSEELDLNLLKEFVEDFFDLNPLISETLDKVLTSPVLKKQ